MFLLKKEKKKIEKEKWKRKKEKKENRRKENEKKKHRYIQTSYLFTSILSNFRKRHKNYHFLSSLKLVEHQKHFFLQILSLFHHISIISLLSWSYIGWCMVGKHDEKLDSGISSLAKCGGCKATGRIIIGSKSEKMAINKNMGLLCCN